MVTQPVEVAAATHRPLAVVYKTTASLIPDPRNARTHPKRQIEQIVASIQAFGFTNPIPADPEGRLIAGHGRLLAAKQAGLAEVPVIELSGLTEAQKKALRLADIRSRSMQAGMSRSSSSSLQTCRSLSSRSTSA